jgi:hypothetical protein
METANSYSGDLEYVTKGRNKTGSNILASIRQNGRAHSISGKKKHNNNNNNYKEL